MNELQCIYFKNFFISVSINNVIKKNSIAAFIALADIVAFAFQRNVEAYTFYKPYTTIKLLHF